MNCRHCSTPLEHVFLDLGFSPPSNAYLSKTELTVPEVTFPLKLYVCDECWLVQTIDYAQAGELFTKDYAYFSSVSHTWLKHAREYADVITARLGLGAQSFVVEVASNDGYLLRNFVAAGIPCLGIEPTASTAAAAEAIGVPVLREFFGTALGERLRAEGRLADLIAGNNVYAHVPDINDFTAGLSRALKPEGTVTLEFPHLMRLLKSVQFDTVYHEHFSYLSLLTVSRIFARAGLRVYDVEELGTHGGSLRVYGCQAGAERATSASVTAVLAAEVAAGMHSVATYLAFQQRADAVKDGLLMFLLESKRARLRVAAYGAAAKGNTLLNYAGVRHDLIAFVCDAAPSKQGKYMPGSHLPILRPDALQEYRPHIVLVLPWNIADEVVAQEARVRNWGGRFAVAVPSVRVW